MRFIRLRIISAILSCGMLILVDPAAHCQERGTWQTEVVDSSRGREAGSFSSLVIDRLGNLHLAYSNLSGTALRYAFREKGGTRWDKTTIDATGGSFETLAVDSRGWAHLAYN